MSTRANDRERSIGAHLGASQDDLSGHEDEKHDFRFDHTVDQTRE